MAWFKVDDKLWGHPKWLAATPTARALWVTAGSWCSDHLTDGKIPDHVIKNLGSRKKDAEELVALELWARHDGGWAFRDWDDYQPSREHVEAERKAARERQAKGREAARLRRMSQQGHADSHADSHAVTSPELPAMSQVPRPDPTRPDPTVVPTELLVVVADNATTPPRPARGTRIPSDFTITHQMHDWARSNAPGVDLERATAKFVNYWSAKTKDATKLDWYRTWQNWIMDDADKVPANHHTRQLRVPGERKVGY